jgi:hypothetical protein
MDETRRQKIENAVARTFQGFRGGHFDEFAADHVINQAAKSFDLFSSGDQAKTIIFVVGQLLPDIPDLKADEVKAAVDSHTADHPSKARLLAQIDEIAKRHGKTDDETLGELLARAAASGDGQAIRLLEMEIGDIRM